MPPVSRVREVDGVAAPSSPGNGVDFQTVGRRAGAPLQGGVVARLHAVSAPHVLAGAALNTMLNFVLFGEQSYGRCRVGGQRVQNLRRVHGGVAVGAAGTFPRVELDSRRSPS